MSLVNKIKNKLKQVITKPANMHTHPGEQHYFDLYFNYIKPHLKSNKKALDIGCQFGRFTIPMTELEIEVTATDIKQEYWNYVEQKVGNKANFRLEKVDETIQNLKANRFDYVLCLELLYNLQDFEETLKGLTNLLEENGIGFFSHRTYGYYIYRYLKEGNFEAIQEILEGKHHDYNAQSVEELKAFYENLGMRVLDIKPIGMFSGFGADAFTPIHDVTKSQEKDALNSLELNPKLVEMFQNNARYLLVIAEKV